MLYVGKTASGDSKTDKVATDDPVLLREKRLSILQRSSILNIENA